MRRTRRHLSILIAAAISLFPLNVRALEAGTERREEPIRVQVNVNLFFAGPTGESEESVKLRDRARRSAYEMAAGECALVEQVFANTCRLESVSININRQSSGQVEGFMAAANFVLRVTLK